VAETDLSYRDLEEMMRERSLSLDHTMIYPWVQAIEKWRQNLHGS
jgi:transposase-like protein